MKDEWIEVILNFLSAFHLLRRDNSKKIRKPRKVLSTQSIALNSKKCRLIYLRSTDVIVIRTIPGA